MTYILDTNIVFLYLRDHHLTGWIDETYNPLGKENDSKLCVVSIGELLSLARKNKWSKAKLQSIYNFTDNVVEVININRRAIQERYADIDAYSQGRLEDIKSPFSARNMGKNDLWIAATASVLNAPLMTTDKDFDHLHGVFLTVIWIDPKTNNDKK